MEWSIFSSQPSAKRRTTLSVLAEQLREVSVERRWSAPECSVCLPDDRAGLKQVIQLAQQKRGSMLKHVIVIGIGGSDLGAKAVYDALGQGEISLDFLETCDERAISLIAKKLLVTKSKQEFLICLVSKSGTTVETLVDAELLLSTLVNKFGALEDRLVVMTNKESSLWRWADTSRVATLAIPALVGGRYSVFSAVGLFPLAVAGIDIHQLLKGARAALKQEWKNPGEGLAAQSASALHGAMLKGKTVYDHFFFIPSFESIGKWCRQLIAESLGKQGKGLLPTVSIGSTDLHSMAQLYLDGPNQRFTLFVSDEASSKNKISKQLYLKGLTEKYSGWSAPELMRVIVQGVKTAYTKKKRLFSSVTLSSQSLYDIGFFLQYKMLEIMFLARLLNVNAFDQPAVELYKREVRKLLA